MATAHVKKGDEVVVIAGAEKGKRGRIIEILVKKQRAIVEGTHLIKKHPNGAIVEKEGTVHLSNLVRAEKFDAKAGKAAA